MKALIQRVKCAHVKIDSTEVASIEQGLLSFVCVEENDKDADVEKLVRKTLNLRIFPDSAQPMNRSVLDVDGEVLVVSQFTLAADTNRGNRPSFTNSASPANAKKYYQLYIDRLAQSTKVKHGIFGADMAVSLVNDGPVTIMLDTAKY